MQAYITFCLPWPHRFGKGFPLHVITRRVRSLWKTPASNRLKVFSYCSRCRLHCSKFHHIRLSHLCFPAAYHCLVAEQDNAICTRVLPIPRPFSSICISCDNLLQWKTALAMLLEQVWDSLNVEKSQHLMLAQYGASPQELHLPPEHSSPLLRFPRAVCPCSRARGSNTDALMKRICSHDDSASSYSACLDHAFDHNNSTPYHSTTRAGIAVTLKVKFISFSEDQILSADQVSVKKWIFTMQTTRRPTDTVMSLGPFPDLQQFTNFTRSGRYTYLSSHPCSGACDLSTLQCRERRQREWS